MDPHFACSCVHSAKKLTKADGMGYCRGTMRFVSQLPHREAVKKFLHRMRTRSLQRLLSWQDRKATTRAIGEHLCHMNDEYLHDNYAQTDVHALMVANAMLRTPPHLQVDLAKRLLAQSKRRYFPDAD